MKNKELAQKTLDYIRMHPEEWDQTLFSTLCGTTMCFAGHAIVMAGGHLKDGLFYYSGKKVSAEGCAAYLLGIAGNFDDEDSDVCRIFYNMTEDFQELENVVKEIFEL